MGQRAVAIKIKKHFLVLNYSQIESMTKDGAKITSKGHIIMFTCPQCLPHTIFFAVGKDDMIACNQIIKDGLSEKNIIVATGSACNTTDV